MLHKLLHNRTGAGAVEFALVAAIISVAAIGAFIRLGGESGDQFNSVQSAYSEVN